LYYSIIVLKINWIRIIYNDIPPFVTKIGQ